MPDHDPDERGVTRSQPSGGDCDAGAYEAPWLNLVDNSASLGLNGWHVAQVPLTFSYSGLAQGEEIGCFNTTTSFWVRFMVPAISLNQSASNERAQLTKDGIYDCEAAQAAAGGAVTQLGVSSGSTLIYKVDSTGPQHVGSCSTTPSSPKAGSWYDQNVTVACTYTSSSGFQIGDGDTHPLTVIVKAATNVAVDSAVSNATLSNPQLCQSDSTGCVAIDSFELQDTAGFSIDVSGDFGGAFAVDLSAPKFTCNPTSSTSWSGQNVTVNCSASDTGSGLDANSPATFSLSTSLTSGQANSAAPTGDQKLCDLVGHCVDAGPFTFSVDLKTPSVTCTIPTAPASGWFTGTVTVSCSGNDDASGLASISYTLDGASTTVGGKSSFTVGVSSDGAHTFSYYATDNAGNASTSQTLDFKIDATKPDLMITINGKSMTTSSGDWYNLANNPNPVAVIVTASDPTSGVASLTCTDTPKGGSAESLTLSLSTSLPAGSITGTATLGDGIQTIDCATADAASNTMTDSEAAQIDRTPPTITLTTPPDRAGYTLNDNVTADFSCADPAPGSGITSINCVGTLANGAAIDTSQSAIGTHTFTVDATDNAGNTGTKSATYTVGYQLVLMPGSTTEVEHGYFALIRFAPEDASGHDYASRNLKVTSVELDGPNNQVIPFASTFQFTMAHDTPQYQLELNTRSLTPGSWTLVVQIGTGASSAKGTITFTAR